MIKDLRGHLALITGGSGGIGLCFSRELASMGCDILMVSNIGSQLQDAEKMLRNDYDVKVYSLLLDLTSENIIEATEEYLNEKSLGPDIIINNAGIFSFCTVDELSDRKLECYIDLHVRAVTLLSRYFARRLKERGGWIMNMSSMSCWMPMPGIALYSATKAYIRVFTRALHYEMRDTGVKVTAACPGGIATDLFGLPDNLKRLALNLHAIDTPERFARKAIRKMLRGRRQYINGFINRMAIVFVASTPTPLRMQIKRRLLDAGIKKL